MGLGDWFRRLLSSPTETAEEEAVLREEFGEQDEAPPDPRPTRGGSVMPGLPGSQAQEAVEAEQEELKPPPDPAP